MVLGLMVGCGGDSDSPTEPSEEITTRYEGQTLEVGTENWDNGKATVEYQYFRDIEGKVVQHGWYKRYDESGTLRIDGTYYEGKEKYNGKWAVYNESGKVMWEANYVDGKLEGNEFEYYDTGKVMWEANYLDGKLVGKWIYYDEDGNITDEDIYENGVCVEMCE